LRGPGFFNAVKLQFRAEFFNILNHENLFFPNSMLFSAAGPNQSAGCITASNPGSTPRQIQFGLKLTF
jgi:hypothetical protein